MNSFARYIHAILTTIVRGVHQVQEEGVNEPENA
jgi:hypothetical protein